MSIPIYVIIFWVIGTLWTVYYWCSETLQRQDRKAIFKPNSDKKGSAASINFSDLSEDEENRSREIQKLKNVIKTRWPSRTSINTE